jgi:hypothetical protein
MANEQDTATQADVKPCRKEYQIKDAAGNPVGNPQVFEGDSWEEVTDKIALAHEQATRRILDLRGKVQPTKAEQLQQYTGRDLSADEKFELSNALIDPSKTDAALDKYIESRLGAPLDKIRQTLTRAEEGAQIERARLEAQAFINKHPEFKTCSENETKMVKYIQDNQLAYTRDNLEIAMDALSEQLLWNDPEPKPAVTAVSEDKAQEAPISAETVEQPISSRPATSASPNTRGKVPSPSLFSHNSGTTGVKSDKAEAEALAKEISRMSPEAFRRRAETDPKFVARVNALGSK